MAGGRPTKYTPKLVARAKAYVNGQWEEVDAIPSIVGLCNWLSVGKDSLYLWAKDDKKEFSDILEKCKAEQERVLLNMGLKGVYNSNIVKLVLGKHGYNERGDSEEQEAQPLTVNLNVVDATKK